MPGPYELYLVRHGLAEERGDKWPDDTKRPLTSDGMSRMKKAARGLDRLGVQFDVILSSPLVRARQTADILSAELDDHPPIVNTDALAPGCDFTALVEALDKHARRGRIALVGHEPGIGELAARLIGSRHPVEFKKGAVCRIDLDELPPGGPGDLRWLLTPKILRAVNK
ncbi:MAG TPA: phosphohistidine phosphatase SixA [Vicinamibacterales bacterium]|jgi:phosphohistidine phosphatase